MSMSVQELLDTLPQSGLLKWIGTRPARKAPMVTLNSVAATTTEGLSGDRFRARSSVRQVTLIQAEHLPVIASCLGRSSIDPALMRRNLVVQGLNLLALKGRCFRIGSVELEATGLCHPCSRMEQLFGAGGYNAVRGHGGITARVVLGGTLSVGDSVRLV